MTRKPVSPRSGQSPQKIRLMIRYDFGDGRRIGPGKMALMTGILTHGSIAAAGRAMGMSYRRAWLLVAELNALFEKPLVVSKPGGKAGGGAQLTAEGQAVLERLQALEARLATEASRDLAALEAVRSKADLT